MKNRLSKHTRTRLIWVEGKRKRAHRVIMERHLGRKLLDTEEVHHINRNPLDNRIENLQVMNRLDHIELHKKEKQKYPDYKNCIECNKEFMVNPRKRARNKCCSKECAQKIRVRAMLKARGL
jgi:hypothetical protein